MNPVAHPLVNKEVAIERFGQADGRIAGGGVMINRARHNGASAGAEAGKARAAEVAIPNERGQRGRQCFEPVVVGRNIAVADLVVADLTITYVRERSVDFTMPFMNLGKWM